MTFSGPLQMKQCLPFNRECAITHIHTHDNAFCAPADSGFAIRSLHFIISFCPCPLSQLFSSHFFLVTSLYIADVHQVPPNTVPKLFLPHKIKNWNILILTWTLHELFLVFTDKGIAASQLLYIHMLWIWWRSYSMCLWTHSRTYYIHHWHCWHCFLWPVFLDLWHTNFLGICSTYNSSEVPGFWWPLSSCLWHYGMANCPLVPHSRCSWLCGFVPSVYLEYSVFSIDLLLFAYCMIA